MRIFIFLSLTLSALTGSAQPSFIILRHAEKMTDIKDPPLSQKGHQRANCLARWIKSQPYAKDIKRVYSSDYRRTLETAAPMASALAVKIRLYKPAKLAELANELDQQATSAIIVGHSNTTPQLASLLAQQELPPMSEGDYDSFWKLLKTENGYNISQLNQVDIDCHE